MLSLPLLFLTLAAEPGPLEKFERAWAAGDVAAAMAQCSDNAHFTWAMDP